MDTILIKHILVVDDEDEYRTLLQQFLEKTGYTCKTASNALEAMELLDQERFDLVISDIKMKEKNGLELMREARENNPDLNFIIMSGHAAEYPYCDIISAGATDFISKPFEIGELKAKLERMEREKQVLRNLHESNEELRAAKSYLENVFENSAAAISIIDQHGKTVRWNKSAVELFGYSLDELKEKQFSELYADKEELSRMVDQLRHKGFVSHYEIDMKRKDGRIVPVDVSVSLLKDEQSKLIGSVGVAENLSNIKKALTELKVTNGQLNSEIVERKRVEEELRKAREELEKLLEERTMKLSKAGDLLKRSLCRMKELSEE